MSIIPSEELERIKANHARLVDRGSVLPPRLHHKPICATLGQLPGYFRPAYGTFDVPTYPANAR